MKLHLNSTEINILFPFHFALNKQLKIISIGQSLRKITTDSILNQNFEDVFAYKRPLLSINYSFQSIAEHYNHLFIISVLSSSSNLDLRGQFIKIENDEVLFFAGSPWLTDVNELDKHHLKINDFSMSDNVTDLLNLLRSETLAMEDIKKLAADLKHERDTQKQTIELLFKEVHHRVKNNMQVIISLINLQKTYITDDQVLNIFQDCQNRIFAMAGIHEKLYQHNSLSMININEYIKNLIIQLIDTYQLQFKINLDIEIEIEELNLDTLVPIGLLTNEIISNTLKYAFKKNDENNTIIFKLKKAISNQFILQIGDNGIGSKTHLDSEHTSFGMDLINILTNQLNGTITRLPVKGTVYEICFTI